MTGAGSTATGALSAVGDKAPGVDAGCRRRSDPRVSQNLRGGRPLAWVKCEESRQERLESCLAQKGGAKRRFAGGVMINIVAQVVDTLFPLDACRHRANRNGRRQKLPLYSKIDPDMDDISHCVFML